ncbi:uncharacterized protein LOC119271909 [Triticum dicoccoides]|uniref:uncharacterized protein LOC119271909 n=1 Tax=Triticum dicoccoides TaxID=85692 RepID=UPI00188E155B|nr:uncharacterized protein LOC119271909 [Triticum dicoccoides]
MAAPMPAPAYDLRCSLLEEGRLPQPQPQAWTVAPRLVPKPKKTNPPWVRAFRAFANTACVLFIVFIFAVMVPRSRDKDHLVGNCVISVLLSLGIPAMVYTLTMDLDDGQPPGARNA